MTRRSLFLGAASAVIAAGVAQAQGKGTNAAPLEARQLVVKVHSYFEESVPSQFGSGVILGMDGQGLYIATARHVVRVAEPASAVYVSLESNPSDSIVATLSDSTRRGYDVAVLTIPRASVGSRWRVPTFDRLGAVEELRFGDAVSPIGCPLGVCWQAPVPADHIVGIDREGVIFQSSIVKVGSSGGALFNEWWEVVGLVTEDAPPRANAVPINQVVDLVRAWGYPVSLRKAKVPRAGYPLHIGALLLTRAGGSQDSIGGEGRFPSGRVVATRRGDFYGLTWHLSGLRLAPRNLAINAAMGGVGVNFHYGRFTTQPFFEVGIGRVEGRWDAHGYYVADGNGSRYVPFWRQEKQDGLGLGAGLSVQALVAPHVTLEVLGGHWSFSVPDSVRKLPDFFVGTGLRWGL